MSCCFRNIGIFPPSALLIDVAVAPPSLTHLTDSSVNGSDARCVPRASELPLAALLLFRNKDIFLDILTDFFVLEAP